MKFTILFSLLVSTSLVYAAPETLASCTTQFGPDQKIEVVQNDDGSIALLETHDGKMEPAIRILSAKEWSSKRIMLRSNDSFLLLSHNNREGYVQAIPTPGSFTESGPAVCD